ncbi:MAG: hypothetical protein ACRDRN_28815, partial [Sciscionella sp.]
VLELVAPSVTFEDPEQKAKQEHESSVRQERLADRLGGKTVEVGDTVTGDDADDADEGGEGDKND